MALHHVVTLGMMSLTYYRVRGVPCAGTRLCRRPVLYEEG